MRRVSVVMTCVRDEEEATEEEEAAGEPKTKTKHSDMGN